MPFSSRALMRVASVYRAGGLGELLLALQLPQLEHLTLLEGRKAGLLLFLFVGGLFVQGGKTVESDRVAAGLEAVAAGIDGDGHGILLAVRHLAGHEPAPDHAVELGGIAADALVHLIGGQARHRGPDGLVGVLRCRGALGLPGALVGADIALAVAPAMYSLAAATASSEMRRLSVRI